MYHKEIKLKIDKTYGYLYFIDKDHPLVSNNVGRVHYHRHVASIKLGRWLEPWEHVHHIDGNRQNNSPENLVIMSHSEHAKEHSLKDGKAARVEKPCAVCGKLTKNKLFCSVKCFGQSSRIVDRPTKEQLEQDIKTMYWVAIGRKYGVSDNSIRYWATGYGII